MTIVSLWQLKAERRSSHSQPVGHLVVLRNVCVTLAALLIPFCSPSKRAGIGCSAADLREVSGCMMCGKKSVAGRAAGMPSSAAPGVVPGFGRWLARSHF